MSEFVEMPADDLLPKPAAANVAAVPATATPEPAPDMEPAEAKAEPKKKPKLRTWVLAALWRMYNFYQDPDTERRYFKLAKEAYNPFNLIEFKRHQDYFNTWAYELEAHNLVASPRLVEEVVCSHVASKRIRLVTEQLDFLAARWDGQDYLTALAATIRTDDPALCARHFQHWLLSVMAQVYDAVRNDYAFVFTGPQGCGKTGFFERLLWNRDYFVSPATAFDFRNKEHALLLNTKVLVLLDEMSSYSKKGDTSDLKAMFSLTEIETDKKYQAVDKYRRLGSFCAATNWEDVLRDPTGDRRFLMHRMHSYDHAAFNAVDKMQLWGQLATLYKQGAHTPFTEEEIKANVDRNIEEFSLRTREDQFIEDMLYVTLDEAHHITTREMLRLINQYDIDNPSKGFALNSITVKAKLAHLGIINKQKKIKGDNQRRYFGVCLLADKPASATDVAASLSGALFLSETGQMEVAPSKQSFKPVPEPTIADIAIAAAKDAQVAADGAQQLAIRKAAVATYAVRDAATGGRPSDAVLAPNAKELLAQAAAKVASAVTPKASETVAPTVYDYLDGLTDDIE